jgi:hypothetical protein
MKRYPVDVVALNSAHAAALSVAWTVCDRAATTESLTGRAADKRTTVRALRAALSAGLLELIIAGLLHPSMQLDRLVQPVFVTGATNIISLLAERLIKPKVRCGLVFWVLWLVRAAVQSQFWAVLKAARLCNQQYCCWEVGNG